MYDYQLAEYFSATFPTTLKVRKVILISFEYYIFHNFSNTNVQSKASMAISAYCCDAIAREEFRENGGLEPIVMLLHSGNDEVRRNAAWAITVTGVDDIVSIEICKLG